MRRSFLVGLLVGFAASVALATAFKPKGVTHFNLLGVLEQASPCPDSRDRPLIEFTDSHGRLLVLAFHEATASVVVCDTADESIATSTTTTTTTTITTTTVTTTTVTTTTTTTTTTAAPTTTTTTTSTTTTTT